MIPVSTGSVTIALFVQNGLYVRCTQAQRVWRIHTIQGDYERLQNKHLHSQALTHALKHAKSLFKLWVRPFQRKDCIFTWKYCVRKRQRERSKREIVCVIFLFFTRSRRSSGASSGVPPWGNLHQTVERLVNRDHGACSVPFSHRTGVVYVLRPAVWPSLTTYCVMLPRELSLPWDCWSAPPLSVSGGPSQLSFFTTW